MATGFFLKKIFRHCGIWQRMSLASRLVAGIGVSLFVIGALLLGAFVRYDINEEAKLANAILNAEISALKTTITTAAVAGERALVKDLLNTHRLTDRISKAGWLSPLGDRIGVLRPNSSDRGGHADAPLWFESICSTLIPTSAESSIVEGNPAYGAVYAEIDLRIGEIWARAVIGSGLTITIIAVIMGIIFSIVLAALRPLRALESGARRFIDGKTREVMDPAGPPEISNIMRIFNMMAAGMEKMIARARQLGLHQEAVREEQNKAVARELHDTIGANLSMIKLGMASLKEDLSEHDPLRVRMDCLIGLTGKTIRLTRSITSALHPLLLDHPGLAAAIESHVRNFEDMSGIKCIMQGFNGIDLPPSHKLAVYRVVQEALNNVARHAGATQVTLTASLDDGIFRMSVSDNGKGMRLPAQSRNGSYGLHSMNERMTHLGGKLVVDSLQGRGTTVSVELPAYENGRS